MTGRLWVVGDMMGHQKHGRPGRRPGRPRLTSRQLDTTTPPEWSTSMMPEPTDMPDTPGLVLPLPPEPTDYDGPLLEVPSIGSQPRRKEPSIKQRARTLAAVYLKLRPLNNATAAAGIVEKAILTGDWTDDDIRTALRVVADEKRPVTIDTLRIALQRGATPARPRAAKTAPYSVVYVMRAPGHRPVKIGKSQEVDARAGSLSTGSPVPLEVLWTTPGDLALERALHTEFKAYRMHGEWFDFGDRDPVEMVANAVNAIKGMRPVVTDATFDHSRYAKLPEYRDAVTVLNQLAHAQLGDMDRSAFLHMVRDMAAALRYLDHCRACLVDVIPVTAYNDKSGRLRCEYECPKCAGTWIRRVRIDSELSPRTSSARQTRRARTPRKKAAA